MDKARIAVRQQRWVIEPDQEIEGREHDDVGNEG
jgi:hypothetical protein